MSDNALRRAFPKHRIRLDPNAVWTVTTAVDVARRLHDHNMEYLEDPVWGMRAMQRVNAKAHSIHALYWGCFSGDHEGDFCA